MTPVQEQRFRKSLEMASDQQVKDMFSHYSMLNEYAFENDEVREAAYLVQEEYFNRGFTVEDPA